MSPIKRFTVGLKRLNTSALNYKKCVLGNGSESVLSTQVQIIFSCILDNDDLAFDRNNPCD